MLLFLVVFKNIVFAIRYTGHYFWIVLSLKVMSSDCLNYQSLFAYTIVVYPSIYRLLFPSLSKLQGVEFSSSEKNGYFQMIITSFLQMQIKFSMCDFWRVFRARSSYEIHCFWFSIRNTIKKWFTYIWFLEISLINIVWTSHITSTHKTDPISYF